MCMYTLTTDVLLRRVSRNQLSHTYVHVRTAQINYLTHMCMYTLKTDVSKNQSSHTYVHVCTAQINQLALGAVLHLSHRCVYVHANAMCVYTHLC